MLMLLYEQPEILRKEKEKRSRTGFSEASLRMMSVPEASSEGCVWEPSMGIGAHCAVHCTNTHGEPSPVTKDLLSKQRRQRKNSRRIRNQLTSPELHDLVF